MMKSKGYLRFGYPCVNLTLANSKCTKKITQKTLLSFKDGKSAYDRLVELGKLNLDGLEKVIEWNYINNVRFFRIYSDLFSHISNRKLESVLGKKLAEKYRNLEEFEEKIKRIGNKIFHYKIRVSFHPNEFACLGSPKEEVIKYSITDLAWHARMVDLMEEGVEKDIPRKDAEDFFKDSVFILHGGGQYGDKKAALQRWAKVYNNLPENIKKRVVLENDERNFNPMDLLTICEKNLIPICLDFFHQECYELMHPEEEICNYEDVMPKVLKIWDKRGIKVKFHHSRQQPERRLGTHSHYCSELPDEVINLLKSGRDVDVMLECKAKDLAWKKACGIFKDWIKEEETDKKLIKKLNEGSFPKLEYLPKEKIGADLIGFEETMSPLERFKELKGIASDEELPAKKSSIKKKSKPGRAKKNQSKPKKKIVVEKKIEEEEEEEFSDVEEDEETFNEELLESDSLSDFGEENNKTKKIISKRSQKVKNMKVKYPVETIRTRSKRLKK